MKALPRGERGWWLKRHRGAPERWVIAGPGFWEDASHTEVALWRLARLQAREIARLRAEAMELAGMLSDEYESQGWYDTKGARRG